jgi:hypothetical protein
MVFKLMHRFEALFARWTAGDDHALTMLAYRGMLGCKRIEVVAHDFALCLFEGHHAFSAYHSDMIAVSERAPARKESSMPVNKVSKTRALNCYFCSKPLKSNDAQFCIFDQEQPPFTTDRSDFVRVNEHGEKEEYGELIYPGGGEGEVNYKTVVLFAHTECGPDSGYCFTFDRLGEHWDEHLTEKTWRKAVIFRSLATARNAMGIKRPPPPRWMNPNSVSR